MYERRTALTVMRIQNLIERRPTSVVFMEEIMKPSNQGKMKSKIRKTIMVKKWVTLSQTHLKWYNTEDELRFDKYSGAVKLPFIFEVVKFSLKEKEDSFRLGVSLSAPRGKEHAGKRDLIFSCKNSF